MSQPRKLKNVSPYANTLLESRVNPAGYSKQDWDVALPAKVSIEDIKKPAYWKQVAAKFNPFDTLRIIPVDNAFYAELLVLQVETGVGAVVKVKYYNDLKDEKSEPLPSKADEFEVKWRGGAKWSVIRKADSTVIAERLETEHEAKQELASYLKTAMA